MSTIYAVLQQPKHSIAFRSILAFVPIVCAHLPFLTVYFPLSSPPSPSLLPQVHDLSSEEDDHEEGEFTIEEEHEATDSEEEDSGEDLYSSLTADALHSLTLSPRKSGEYSNKGAITWDGFHIGAM